jgi:N-sulfoglucosamine sulfohydrolase
VDTPKTRLALANYYQDITTTDGRVGEVLASLQRHGLTTNLLFIYTTDQGAEWPRCKWTLYDSGLRVPFIARWPSVLKPGSESGALISLVDLTPTLVAIAGGKVPAGLDGRSFREVLLGRKKTFRQELYASHSGDGAMNLFPQRGVRDTCYKYILNLHPEREWTTHFTKVTGISNSHAEVWNTWLEKAETDPAAARLVNLIVHHAPEELYDTKADPYELTNLVGCAEMKGVLQRLRKRLAQWRRQVGDQEE